MRRIGVALAAVAAVMALTAGTLFASNPPGVTGTLNQNQHDISAGFATWDFHFALAQTFTPDVTGTLNAVGVYIAVTPPQGPQVVGPAATGDTVIGVFNVVGGVPSGAIATEAVNVVSQAPGWVYFEIPSPPSVVAGTPYAITVAGAGENPTDNPDLLNWYGDCAPVADYPGGQALVFDDAPAIPVWQTVLAWEAAQPPDGTSCQQDFAFETYITAAPVPTASPVPTAVPTANPTPPPTSTIPANGSGNGGQAPLVVFASLAAAAAFVTLRRYGLARR